MLYLSHPARLTQSQSNSDCRLNCFYAPTSVWIFNVLSSRALTWFYLLSHVLWRVVCCCVCVPACLVLYYGPLSKYRRALFCGLFLRALSHIVLSAPALPCPVSACPSSLNVMLILGYAGILCSWISGLQIRGFMGLTQYVWFWFVGYGDC